MSLLIAASIEEAIDALAGGARPIAGGTDLVVGARHGKSPLPALLVAIDRIEALRRIEDSVDEGLTIGAAVSHHEIEGHRTIAAMWSALADASALVGSPATRHVGTLGGNVMNGSPAMDTGAPLAVFQAEAVLRSGRGTRSVAMRDLWVGPGRTSAAVDELCIAIHLPARPTSSGSAYVRLEYRRAMEIAVVGAAASVSLNDDGTVSAMSVALTAVAPVILTVTGLKAVDGRSVGDIAALAAALASEQATPISDVRASDRYRRHCIGVMARRSVAAAASRAAGEVIAVPVNRTLGIGAAS